MGLGASLFLIAIGAILRWAVTATTSGINLHVVGVILIIVGGFGLCFTLFWMISASDRDRRAAAGAPPDTRPSDSYPPQARF